MEDSNVIPRVYPPFSLPGNIRTYAKEKTLFSILAVFSALFWIGLTVSTVGTIWLFLGLFYLVGLAAQSYFISHLQGNAVKIGPRQLPELHARLDACRQAIGMKDQPEFYLMTGNGALNAFATRFLRRYYVVLLSDIVDALHDDEGALNFYIGHELGHIAQKHLTHHWWISFAMLTPLLGSAYSRAREYSCDQYGLACCHDTDSAMRALAVLAAGGKRWKTLNLDTYIGQSERSGGFWMSLNELTADYPWLSKRVARVQRGDAVQFPRRHMAACALAALVPRTGFGIIGGLILYLYVGIVGATLAIPFYQSYVAKAKITAQSVAAAGAYAHAMKAAEKVGQFFVEHKRLPATVREAGFDAAAATVQEISIDPDGGVLVVGMTAPLADMVLYLTPSTSEAGITWACRAEMSVPSEVLPAGCSHSTPDEDHDEDENVEPAAT